MEDLGELQIKIIELQSKQYTDPYQKNRDIDQLKMEVISATTPMNRGQASGLLTELDQLIDPNH